MCMRKRMIIWMVLVSWMTGAWGQEIGLEVGQQPGQEPGQPERVPYSPDFEFNDGIYANFQMVRNNDPIPTARIVTDVDMFDRDFYDKVTAQKEIVIYDDNGVKKVMNSKDIWGYGRNGHL